MTRLLRNFIPNAGSAIVLLCVVFGSEKLTAAEVFDHFGVPDGLSQATVHCIAEDQKGFLWIGTDDGLNRYDGRNFVTFRSIPSDSLTLFDNGVWSILELDSSALLVGTQRSGLSRYDRKTGVFSSLLSDSVIALLDGSAFTSLALSFNGELWAGTNDGGLVWLDDSLRIARVFQNTSNESSRIPTNRIRCICPDIDGSIWIGTSDAGLLRFDASSQFVEMTMVDSSFSANTQIQDICLAADSTLWIAVKGHGVFVLNRMSGAFQKVFSDSVNTFLSGLLVRDFVVDHSGVMWLATGGNGLVQLNTKTSEFHVFSNDDAANSGPADDQLLCIKIARSGDVWCGTWGNGFSRLRQLPSAFKSIPVCSGTDLGQVIGLAETPRARVLIGTLGNGIWQLRSVGAECAERIKNDAGEVVLDRGNYTMFLLDPPVGVWLGTYRAGLQHFNLSTGHLSGGAIVDDHSLLPASTTVLCAVRSRNGTGWLGTAGNSLVKLEPRGGDGQTQVSRLDGLQLSNDIVYSLFEDSRNNLWIGTLNGLDVLDSNERSINELHYERRDSKSLSNNEVRVVTEDPDGDIWIGTSNGLNRYRSSTGELWRYTEADGLANSVIYSCVVDRRGDVWVSTNRGVSRIRARSDRIENFYTSDGIPPGEFNQGAGLLLSNDAVMFGGTNALVRFQPDSVRVRHVPFVILGITDFRTNKVLVREPGRGAEVRIPSESNSITIEYVALDFYGSSLLDYEYRLEGLDAQWIKGHRSTTAVFTNLLPGRYRFSVRRRDDELPISAVCDFIVEPAWYQTRTAKGGAALIGVLAIALSYGLIMRREERKRKTAVKREIQRDINRRMLLEALAVVSHGGTVASNIGTIKRRFGTYVAGSTPPEGMRLDTAIHSYTTFTREKLFDIVQKSRVAEISEPVVTKFSGSLSDLDRTLVEFEHTSDPERAAEIAETARTQITVIEESYSLIVKEIGRYFVADVIAACATVLEAKREDFEAKNISVEFLPPENSKLECLFTRQELEEVLDDLLNNSIEALTESTTKRIVLSAENNDPQVVIRLRDTGKGIAESQLQSVFDRDFSTKSSKGGGFGLYNAKQKIELYQGRIEFSLPDDQIGAEAVLKLRIASYPQLHAKA
ncbi:MAG: GHKL domain-containing protein [Calditrichaeota bacterium]|nr:GHKL domain-containing protein [Calditrichota bacterium]